MNGSSLPDSLPSKWLQEIKEALNPTLPASIPAPWLQEIKEAIKPTSGERTWAILGAVLGSGVIAALVAAGASYMMLKPTANSDLEKTQVIEKRQELGNLRNHLALLNSCLDNVPDAHQLQETPKLWGYAKKSVDRATDEMAVILEEVNDSRIDASIGKETTQMLDGLGPKMEPALKDVGGMSDLAQYYSQTARGKIRKIQEDINTKTEETKL